MLNHIFLLSYVKTREAFFLKVELALSYNTTTMKSVVSFVKIIYIRDSRSEIMGQWGVTT